MDLQHSISFNKNQELIGTEQLVIIDSPDPDEENQMIGRTIWDAPEIDQQVFVEGEYETGRIIRVMIEDAGAYELYASGQPRAFIPITQID